MQTLVLGLGNELLGDEGVGVHAARQLQNEFLSEDIKLKII
jgi:Ni,Fe-hydrogenase maturation factor